MSGAFLTPNQERPIQSDCNMQHPMMRSIWDSWPSAACGSEEETVEIKKGAWTEEEDSILRNFVTLRGEGRWNSVALCSGLKRTGKSYRLRWLNYLRPNVRRGKITLQEQLLILDLHFRWGNRWSKIAQHLLLQMKCDVDSKQFRDALRLVWMPRLLERIRASSSSSAPGSNHHVQVQSDPCFSALPSSEIRFDSKGKCE
ncbi:transcription factor MYB108-like [Prosopis cineraria]|uniref:transcription factor MYB108-like n=1 Tax=Prosopis cineraria TaxID=364024 RepID=UPI00240EDE95|nr:transcription factor MYB108-like [Prosopis cineraria]